MIWKILLTGESILIILKADTPWGYTEVGMKQDAVRKSILVRLRRIEGQVKGIQRMIEEEEDCEQILNQVSAVRSAVNQVGVMVFKKYAKECILDTHDEQSFQKALDDTLEKMNRIFK